VIELTTLKGDIFFLNEMLVYRIDLVPDTLITLTDGNRIRVQETPSEIIERIRVYQRSIGGVLRLVHSEDRK